jgi:hypothetical protein
MGDQGFFFSGDSILSAISSIIKIMAPLPAIRLYTVLLQLSSPKQKRSSLRLRSFLPKAAKSHQHECTAAIGGATGNRYQSVKMTA